jgi:phage protein D
MRDPERQNLYGNRFSVSFPDFPAMTRLPRVMTVHQKMGNHDMVELTYQAVSPFMVKSLKTGVPIKITYSNDKTTGTFLGHVLDVSYPVSQTLERPLTLTCISSSFVMKDRISKIWVNRTATEIVKDLGDMFGFNVITSPSKTRFSQQSLSGHSVWEKIHELADRIGYGVKVIGNDLYFLPIDKMIDTFVSTIPSLSFLDPFNNYYTNYNAPTLNKFEAKLGDFVQSEGINRTNKVVSGVDPVTGKIYKSTSSPHTIGKPLKQSVTAPLFSTIESSTVVGSAQMAQDMSEAKAHISRLSIPAKGDALGDPRISPWSTVQINGTGISTDGFWIVKSATHTIHYDGRYFTSFTCATDGVGLNKPSATRPSRASLIPLRDLISPLTTAKTKPSSYKLSAADAMVKQSVTGFNTLKRRWTSHHGG